LDLIAFARDAENAKRIVCARRAAEREATPRLAKRGKARATSALIELNSMLDKRMLLKGILSEEGWIASGGEASLQFLDSHVHYCETGMAEEIKEYLEKCTRPQDFCPCVLPDSPLVAGILSKLADSGAGPDGIPYSAWLAAVADGVKTLLNFILFLMEGSSPPSWFGEMLQVFYSER